MQNELPSTFPRLVSWAAERYSDSTAIEDGERCISFWQLANQVSVTQRAFMGFGIQKGDRVAICAPNSAEWIIAALGLQAAGAILVPLSTRAKSGELGYALKKSGSRILLTVDNFLGNDYAGSIANERFQYLEEIILLRGTKSGCREWQSFLCDGEAVSSQASRDRSQSIGQNDVCDLMFTSGTTGKPKVVVTEHGQNIRAFDYWSEKIGLNRDDRFLLANPFYHTFGYKAGWLACLIRGAVALPHPVFDSAKFLNCIEKDRITVLTGPPTVFYSMLADELLSQVDISTLRVAVTGGANIPVQLIREMYSRLELETVISAYGLTECCGLVSMCEQGDDIDTIATTSGRAVPGLEVRCVDDDMNNIPTSEQGEIVVRGYAVMQGYLDDPEATAHAITHDGWLRTGDIGSIDEKGYIRIIDRKDDMFQSGGFNCYPAEIENVIRDHKAVKQVVVVGVPDARLGSVPLAFIQLVHERVVSKNEIVEWCRQKISNYKVPRYVEFLDELPLTDSGKLHRRALQDEAMKAISYSK